MIVSGVECWSIGPVLLRMGLRPSLIFNNQSWLFLELNLGPLDLSFWSWAFGPSSFLIQHYVMVMSISGVGYCSFGLALLKLGLRTSFILYNKSLLFLDFDVGALDLSFWRGGRGGPGWVGWARANQAGRAGRARLGTTIRIVYILCFLDKILKTPHVLQLLLKLGPAEENHELLTLLESGPYCSIIIGPKNSNNIAKIKIIQGHNSWPRHSNHIGEVAINRCSINYWSIVGPSCC